MYKNNNSKIIAQNTKSKYSELASNTMLFVFSSLLSKAIMFFLLPLYTNVLTTEEYGIIELIMTGTNLLTPIFTLSFSDAIIRFGLDNSIPKNRVLKVSTIYIFFVSIIMILCTPAIKLYKPIADYAWLFTITMVTLMYRSTITLYLKVINNNLLFAIDTIIYTLILAALNIILLLFFNMRLEGYLYSIIISSVLSFIYCAIGGRIFRRIIYCRLV